MRLADGIPSWVIRAVLVLIRRILSYHEGNTGGKCLTLGDRHASWHLLDWQRGPPPACSACNPLFFSSVLQLRSKSSESRDQQNNVSR
jgi:hypothetical protein